MRNINKKYNKEKEKAYATRECHLGKDEQQHGRLVPEGKETEHIIDVP